VPTRWRRGFTLQTSRVPARCACNTIADEGTAFFSLDGLSLYFYSSRAGGPGLRDIYVSKRADPSLSFTASSLVGGVNGTESDHMPWLPLDELTIYFTSSRYGTGIPLGYNIWVATRASRSNAFGAPRLVSELNSASSDEGASLTKDELTVFFASDRASSGNFDIWTATRASKAVPFTTPVSVPGVNSPDDEFNVAVTADGQELFFSSDRGAGTNYTLWRSIRSCD